MRFQPVPHYIPANAVEFAADGARSPSAPTPAPTRTWPAFAAGTDLLMVEATLLEPEPPGRRAATSRPFEAGEHAAQAGAKRLVLTHFADEPGVDWVRDRGGARVRRGRSRRPARVRSTCSSHARISRVTGA